MHLMRLPPRLVETGQQVAGPLSLSSRADGRSQLLAEIFVMPHLWGVESVHNNGIHNLNSRHSQHHAAAPSMENIGMWCMS